jgi:putative acetyltransferase
MKPEIRLIEPHDNPAIAQLIKDVLLQFGCSGPGHASDDPELNDMFSAYQGKDSRYWVVIHPQTGKLLGGGGFSRLKGTRPEDGICELQKLYFVAEARGQGLGHKIIERAMLEACKAGYREMYLETIPQLKQAVGLYEKFGFRHLDAPVGNTGHQARVTYFMSRPLQPSSVETFDLISISA